MPVGGILISNLSTTNPDAALDALLRGEHDAIAALAGEPEALGDAYARRLIGGRKRGGVYYTPPDLVAALLDCALEPVLDGADSGEMLSHVRVCDPACGCGHFLIAAARRIGERFERLGLPRERAIECLYGVDIDPVATEICRAALRLALGTRPDHPVPNIVVADALAQPLPFTVASFDVVIGNPPFVNGIEGGVSDECRALVRRRWPDLAGTLDLSAAFVRLSADILRPGGRLGLVLPLISLSSRSLSSFRAAPPSGLHPNLILIPGSSSTFRGALVYVCGLVMGPVDECVVVRDGSRSTPSPLHGADWWAALSGEARSNLQQRTVGDIFTVRGSLAVGEAYEIVRYLYDDTGSQTALDAGPKLVTTGLIDPGECMWGQRACRYLGKSYARPRVASFDSLPPSIARRVEQACRPKVLVAGLSRRIEAYFDVTGECMGAVSTFTILHPDDDAASLARLCDFLNSDQAHALYLARLGAYRVGGGDITMRKEFLAGLPWEGS